MNSIKKLYWWWVKLPFDKKAHFGLGKDIAWVTLTIVLLLGLFSQLWYLLPVGIVSTIAAFGKELYDKYIKKTTFDVEDAKMTVYGGAIVTIYQYVFLIIQQLIKVYIIQ